MTTKKKTSDFGTIVGENDADVFDNPTVDSPKVCQIKPGRVVRILSKPNKKFVGIGITNTVLGFVQKENIKVE